RSTGIASAHAGGVPAKRGAQGSPGAVNKRARGRRRQTQSPTAQGFGPSIATQSEEIVCPICGAHFEHPSAESFSFNSYGACPVCQGRGVRSYVDVSTLVPDPGKTIGGGA